MARGDSGKITTKDSAAVETFTREEVDAMLAEANTPNTAPAIEEGPHLKKGPTAEAKRRQLVDAGVSSDDELLTDDMRRLLAEGE